MSQSPEPRAVVFNSGPLIALAGIGQLELLHRLFGQVRPLLEAMRGNGYYLSPRFIEHTCIAVGE
jgi:predicted nucleic acid-binding protein